MPPVLIFTGGPHQRLPWWLSWWRISLQCGRHGFNPWVRKIPWRRKQLPTPDPTKGGASERETQGLERRLNFYSKLFWNCFCFFLFACFSYVKNTNDARVRSDKTFTGISFSEKLALMPQGRMNHFSVWTLYIHLLVSTLSKPRVITGLFSSKPRTP